MHCEPLEAENRASPGCPGSALLVPKISQERLSILPALVGIMKSIMLTENPGGQPGDATVRDYDPAGEPPMYTCAQGEQVPQVTSTKSLRLI